MELDSLNDERLKKIALAATALVVGGAAVKYVWQDGRIKGYAYNLAETSGAAFIGLVNRVNDKKGYLQFSGLIKNNDFIVDQASIKDLSPEILPEFESVFKVSKK